MEKTMTKFDKSVELAKIQIEERILEDVKRGGAVILPNNVEMFIIDLGGDWYYNLLLSAGYSATTAKRKHMNWDYDKLANKLDTWYKTELYPKYYNRFKSENREIITLELPKTL